MTKKSANNKQTIEIPKFIILTGKFFAFISPKLATLYTDSEARKCNGLQQHSKSNHGFWN